MSGIVERTSQPASTVATEPVATSSWRDVSVFLGGQGLSLAADQAFFVAVLWVATRIGGNTAATAVTLAECVPRAVTMLFGGAICDSLGPRAVALRATSARVVVLSTAAVVALTTHSLALLIVVTALEGTMLGLASPSFGSLLPRMVHDGQLSRANSMRTMVARSAPIIGSPVGAWLIATGHLSIVLLVVAVGCLVSVCCVGAVTAGLTAPTAPATRLLRRSTDGFRLLRSHRKLYWLFVSGACINLGFAWPLNPALPVLMDERHWGVRAVGLVIACFGAGAMVSAGLGIALADRIPAPTRLVVSSAGIGICLLLMILAPDLAWMAIAATAVGAFSGQNGPAAVTLYQQAAPKERLGAAMAMFSLAGIGAAPFAYAVFGAVAGLTSPTTAWIASSLLVLAAPIAAFRAISTPAKVAAPAVSP